ncbi:MAG TPA: peptidoglycan-binding domain-containing protein, partial [Ilumatobacteraceae bacterium]|nr:peptidoglycan-binding domain-containing protein [Ilumatobacteraceae bacterium]
MVKLVHTRTSLSVVVAFGVVALVGCSTAVTSGTGAGDLSGIVRTEDTPITTQTTAPTTTEAPATTAEPTTTAAPATTEATITTVAPTTLPPTTTVAPNIIEVPVVDPPLRAVGTSGGQETARVQQRLFDLGFWLSAVDGGYGLTTTQAVMAFEKYMGFDA